MSAFAKQQTIETQRDFAELASTLVHVSNERAEAGRREYRAERTRLYKLRLIREWRAKRKGA
jgi:hypothetical protein